MSPPQILIRPLREEDVYAASEIFRDSFMHFLGITDRAIGEKTIGDADYIRTRLRGQPDGAVAAELNGDLVGALFSTRWGSVTVCGPVIVKPQKWSVNVGPALVEWARSKKSDATLEGGYTFSHTPRHIEYFERLGFFPRFLTMIMASGVPRGQSLSAEWVRFSRMDEGTQKSALHAARSLCERLYPGLDLGLEIESVHRQQIGDTLFLWTGTELDAFAVCHLGKGSEAGSNACYIKFAAVRPGAAAESTFDRLLKGTRAFASEHNLTRLTTGVNTSHDSAYRKLRAFGFMSTMVGIALHRPNIPAYHLEEFWVLDDWR